MQDWHIYFVRTRYGSLYTGIATDVARRLAEHGQENGRGAKYLRSKGPFELAYQTKIGDRALALKAERCVKKLSKDKKESIVTTKPTAEELVKLLGLSEGSTT
jgi:putative endonuclease